MKRALLFVALALAFVTAANAQKVAVGGTVDNFSLPDINGTTQTLKDMKGANGAVLIFVSSECPVVRGYNERMNEIALAYKAKGINVIGVNSNATETLAEVKA